MRLHSLVIPLCVLSSYIYPRIRYHSDMAEDNNLLSSRLYLDIEPAQLPIIYHSKYDISFFGLEKLHPFDTQKWGHIYKYLLEAGILMNKAQSVEPLEINELELLSHHTRRYIQSLDRSLTVSMIAEIPPIALLPKAVVKSILLTPLKFQTGGTVLGGKLAVERGWAINLGGGFHHCSSDTGGGFCFYADISICIHYLFRTMPDRIKKVMIIDLDAHQGNGHELDFIGDERVFILDAYNNRIYPGDMKAKSAISMSIELQPGTDDSVYIPLIREKIPEALDRFKPDLVLYNAGTDIMARDPLGALAITSQGIITRDEIVWQECRSRAIPILMVTSGGYQAVTGRVVADSIINLQSKGLLK